jgi:hypothetical protein
MRHRKLSPQKLKVCQFQALQNFAFTFIYVSVVCPLAGIDGA